MYLKVICSVDDEFGSICYNSHFFQIIIAPLWYRKLVLLELYFYPRFSCSLSRPYTVEACKPSPMGPVCFKQVVLHRISVTGTSSRDQDLQTVTNNMKIEQELTVNDCALYTYASRGICHRRGWS